MMEEDIVNSTNAVTDSLTENDDVTITDDSLSLLDGIDDNLTLPIQTLDEILAEVIWKIYVGSLSEI